ncbi:MAG: DUF3865 domain-containing protein [Patescibacteria group bacterium]|nr:DUF3865 domain-containing protein [Patescibacteria group bacterium]
MHTSTWEPGHEAGLRESASAYITSQNETAFALGFKRVLILMDDWWRRLAHEARGVKSNILLPIRIPSS